MVSTVLSQQNCAVLTLSDADDEDDEDDMDAEDFIYEQDFPRKLICASPVVLPLSNSALQTMMNRRSLICRHLGGIRWSSSSTWVTAPATVDCGTALSPLSVGAAVLETPSAVRL